MKFTVTKKILLGFTAAVTVFATVITLAPAGFLSSHAGYIDPETDAGVLSLEGQISSIEKRLSDLDKCIEGKAEDIISETSKKQAIDEELSLVNESITLNNKVMKAYQEAIEKKEQEIADQERDIEEKYSEFEEWIKVFYETGELSFLQMIFDNDNFNDVLTTTEYIAVLMESKNEFMASLEKKVIDLNAEKESIEVYKQSEEVAKSKNLLQQQKLQKLAQDSADYLSTLKSDKLAYEKQYDKALEEEEKLNKELEEELERIALQNAVYVGGSYIWPLDTSYSRISSPYGWRDFQGGEYHLGIDIPCSFGSNIYAANAGKVIKAEQHYSYGYYVLIDHGGGQATLYAHNSKLMVKVGDIVDKGDVIALAGSTGNSYGNHCHFEVRINGKTTDPLEYVTQP